MILLDTSVLSAVLRRRQAGPTENRLATVLQGLLSAGQRVSVPGLVVQELLSGFAKKRSSRGSRRSSSGVIRW